MCASSQPDPFIATMVHQKAKNGVVTCAVAHHIARILQTDPKSVGYTIQHMGFRIGRCQLGLFGHPSQPGMLKVTETRSSTDVQSAIEACVVQNCLSCHSCWQIASQCRVSKMDIARCAEVLNIKITCCQLGLF